MKRPARWFDGLRARMAAALLVALLAQFIGGEIIFERIEAARIERAHARRLAERLVIAGKLAESHADAVTAMNGLWAPSLVVARTPVPPAGMGGAGRADLAAVAEVMVAARPQLAGVPLRLARDGATLRGGVRLADGSWLHFRETDYFSGNSMLLHYTASVLLLVACVVLMALLFGRMLGRPLRRIAEAAERVGGAEAVPIAVEGPREVRQVAAAFERMQARLLNHVREREQSLAAMSHDLRTPLARLRLNLATVEDGETRAALKEDVAEMETFVTSVLDYLRGDEAEHAQRADVASILMTVVDEAHDRGEAVDYHGPDRVELLTRPVKLKRLIRNIVQNATRHAGSARVRLEADAVAVVIFVDDDGPGIPETQMQTVFEPFARIDPARGRHTGGVGLGLTIARRLSERLGGTIALANREEGGLRVTICLPRLDRLT
ncbi:ATP-binding protein [Sphingomonas flavalba]|uniref:ATP-binding protein n=1 Tax=Sphingomonas flavalba TaxID=2559804 RepID=UPI0039DFD4F8